MRFWGATYRVNIPTKNALNNEKVCHNFQRKRLKQAQIQGLLTCRASEKLRICIVIQMHRLSWDYVEKKSRNSQNRFRIICCFFRFVFAVSASFRTDFCLSSIWVQIGLKMSLNWVEIELKFSWNWVETEFELSLNWVCGSLKNLKLSSNWVRGLSLNWVQIEFGMKNKMVARSYKPIPNTWTMTDLGTCLSVTLNAKLIGSGWQS